jgi:type IV secretory pathway TrbD component
VSDLRKTPMYRALHRPNLILGGERMLVIILLFVSFATMVLAMNVYAFIIGTFLLVVSMHGLRQMAKADPFMFRVWARQVYYKEYYAAYSRPARIGRNTWNAKGY